MPPNERTSGGAENAALQKKLAELEAELAAARQESHAKELLLAKQAKEIEAAQQLLTERASDVPLAEKFGAGKCVAMANCIFTAEDGTTVHAQKGDLCKPCALDLAKLKNDGVLVLT